MKQALLVCGLTGLLSACISSPWGIGLEATLYAWDDQTTPLATRIAGEDTVYAGFFDGDIAFGDLLATNPDIDQGADTPYLLELCEGDLCYFLVLFPGDFSQDAAGTVLGWAAISAISTAAYYEVRELPASAVRPALDELASKVVGAGDSGPGVNNDGLVDYTDLALLDYQTFSVWRDLLLDQTLPQRLEAAIEAGSEPVLSDYLGASVLTGWVVNNEDRSSTIFESDTSEGVLVNVQSVESSGDYVAIQATGIPDYIVRITDELLSWLNGRPKAAEDFATGASIVQVGQSVSFGEDIGYNSNANSCAVDGGFGYWPPGPECPENVAHNIVLPLQPEPTDTECATGAGSVGYYVNGTSVFNWTDAQSYNSEGVWQTLAPVAELYDVDICGGHAARGEYHHHFYSECLAELVGDTGDGHSPVYGYAADGYPIYGPWQDQSQLAISSWRTRDYDDPDSATGCGEAGVRSCLLVDVYAPGLGTEPADFNGPDTQGTYLSLSRNSFDTASGFFFEDWYWGESLSEQGGPYLDQYNGHSDDSRGYHYHVTIELVDGAVAPSFPYAVGARFAGKLQDNAAAMCSSGQIGGPPGGGPPPGGMPPGG